MTSRTSRDLPDPAAPASQSEPPEPATAPASKASAAASSAVRPTTAVSPAPSKRPCAEVSPSTSDTAMESAFPLTAICRPPPRRTDSASASDVGPSTSVWPSPAAAISRAARLVASPSPVRKLLVAPPIRRREDQPGGHAGSEARSGRPHSLDEVHGADRVVRMRDRNAEHGVEHHALVAAGALQQIATRLADEIGGRRRELGEAGRARPGRDHRAAGARGRRSSTGDARRGSSLPRAIARS